MRRGQLGWSGSRLGRRKAAHGQRDSRGAAYPLVWRSSGLERLQDEHDVVVIEDCAQAAGAERDGRPTGLAGLLAGTTFYPTKNLGSMGDGGVVRTHGVGPPRIGEGSYQMSELDGIV